MVGQTRGGAPQGDPVNLSGAWEGRATLWRQLLDLGSQRSSRLRAVPEFSE